MAERSLFSVIGEMNYDGLIAELEPAVTVGGATIRKLGSVATLKRGTILAMSSGSAGDGKLVVLGNTAASNETLTPYGILCEDIDVGTSDDVKAAVYLSGAFDPDKVTVKASYDITAADIDALRVRNIRFVEVSD